MSGSSGGSSDPTSTNFLMTRRNWLAQAAALAASAAAPSAFAQDDVIRLGQTVALTGPLADIGAAMHQGSKLYFDAVNARGGVNGRRIELVARDDGYDVKRALANIDGFIKDPGLFGLFGCMGTPIIEGTLPLIRNTDIPCFSPLTGASSARPADMRNVLNLRASYPEETERLVEHLATIGIQRVGVAYQNNSFGKEVMSAAEAAMKKHRLQAVVSAPVQSDASDAAAAAKRIAAAGPEAVLLGLAGKPTVAFIKAFRAEKRGLPLYALSVMGSAATLSALGDDGIGIAVSQVVPMPTNAVVPVVRDFQQAWKAAPSGMEPSHLALEGFINARVFVEALQRAGRNLTRKSFVDAVWSIHRLDIGGFELHFQQPGRNASRFVELTMIGRGGKFIR
ncbi:ABC transporter substrate-binding protein [Piscinibacter terrae]|uniref:ABC transporter substrate-binding protein n=1 Tax=Piscinibacter terrae TaxID=2496871 RepID=A0A3N7HZ80_9BURK|nr:ABC transporter substrate-binding protein [Albitalea terrae]RQP26421.1 ABC transporter substrate-binding protein [Albitalea terrae]